MKTIAIYHKNCSDGTAAAAVILKKYPDALVFPMAYGYEPKEMAEIVARAEPGDQIFTVDCVMGAREFLAAGYKVTSIDHHIGIKDEYQQLAKENADFTFVFDNSKSGSSLAWSYFFPDEKLPEIIAYIEDFDLWKWKLGENTKYIASYLFSMSDKPEEVIKLFGAPLDTAKNEGRIINTYSDFIIHEEVKDIEPINLNIIGHTVPFYNITSNKSYGGNLLATARNQVVGLFTIDGHQVTISFRSLDQHSPSALDIAKAVGGGGHRNAAGARMNLADFIKAII